jgi:hypothetical protein
MTKAPRTLTTIDPAFCLLINLMCQSVHVMQPAACRGLRHVAGCGMSRARGLASLSSQQRDDDQDSVRLSR